MPTPLAEQRENAVIDRVVDSLIRSGQLVTILDRPDRSHRGGDGLTVDAELAVGGERWALDVMTLRWQSELESLVQKLKRRLEDEFGTQLDNAGKTLIVTCHISSDEQHIRALVDLSRQTMGSGQSRRRGSEVVSLWSRSPQLGAVKVEPVLGQSANVREEIVLSLGDALKKKLRGQLSRARALGYRTSLAIDQRGAPDLEFRANVLALPETVASAIERVEATVGTLCDILVLIQESDRVLWLRR